MDEQITAEVAKLIDAFNERAATDERLRHDIENMDRRVQLDFGNAGKGHLHLKDCKIGSLEDGEVYAARSRAHIARYGLTDWADIIHAPLQRRELGSEEYLWYATEQLPQKPIDMLVIDGPSGFIQKNSRYPALPLLFDRLSDRCVIFLDDAARDDEREIVARWQAEFPGIGQEYIRTERGCSRLTIERSR